MIRMVTDQLVLTLTVVSFSSLTDLATEIMDTSARKVCSPVVISGEDCANQRTLRMVLYS